MHLGSLRSALLLLCALVPLAAHADTFDFNFQRVDTNGNGTTATGTLTTTGTPGDGIQTITGINGTYNLFLGNSLLFSEAITGVPQPDNAYGADDLLYLNGGPYLDDTGFTFTVNGGGDDFAGDVNIAYFNGAYYEPIEITTAPGTFTVSPVSSTPEPPSLVLLGCATLLLSGVFRYRRTLQPGIAA
jgi:hypothetical protein